MKFIFITADPGQIEIAQAAGVDRIMIDLETIGKLERQAGRNTLISAHSYEDVVAARKLLSTSELLVRVNPMHTGSSDEINTVIAAGADRVMLPMFHTVDEAHQFVELVDGRARVTLLIETPRAVGAIADLAVLEGVDDIHIGLNDLHIARATTFMFEALVDGLVESCANELRSAGMPFGFGGVARVGHGALPAELVLAAHVRLGSEQVILSRDFRACFDHESDIESFRLLRGAVDETRRHVSDYEQADVATTDQLRADLANAVEAVVEQIRAET